MKDWEKRSEKERERERERERRVSYTCGRGTRPEMVYAPAKIPLDVVTVIGMKE